MVGPYLSVIWFSSPLISYLRIVYRPFRFLFFLSLLHNSPDLRLHDSALFDRVFRFEGDAVALAIATIVKKLALSHGQRLYQLVYSSYLLGLLTWLLAVLPSTAVF